MSQIETSKVTPEALGTSSQSATLRSSKLAAPCSKAAKCCRRRTLWTWPWPKWLVIPVTRTRPLRVSLHERCNLHWPYHSPEKYHYADIVNTKINEKSSKSLLQSVWGSGMVKAWLTEHTLQAMSWFNEKLYSSIQYNWSGYSHIVAADIITILQYIIKLNIARITQFDNPLVPLQSTQ